MYQFQLFSNKFFNGKNNNTGKQISKNNMWAEVRYGIYRKKNRSQQI